MEGILEFIRINGSVRCYNRFRRFLQSNNGELSDCGFSDFCNYDCVTKLVAKELKEILIYLSDKINKNRYRYSGVTNIDIINFLNK